MTDTKEQHLLQLLNKRQRTFDRLNRIETFMENIDSNTTTEAISVRMESLDKLLTEFTSLEDKILLIPSQTSEMDDFETRYFDAKAFLKHVFNDKNGNETELSQFNQTMSQFALNQKSLFESLGQNSTKSEVRLPHITIPPFSGNYEEFPAFKDLFESSVHSNMKLSKVHKFQYLKGCLKDEAASLIRHINVTENNYEEAWAKIVDRYDKKKQVITKYVKVFLDIPSIQKPTPDNLRQLFNTSDEVIRGLRALGAEAEKRDPWLVNILLSKLDNDTRQQWAQKTLNNDFPSIESFLKFVNERCDAIENSETFTYPSSTLIAKQHNKTSTIKVHHSTKRSNITVICPCCDTSNHPLYKCQKFKAMDIDQRRAFVLEKRICFNCLFIGHLAQSCTSKFLCHTCRGKHHTMLHLHQVENQMSNNISTLTSTAIVDSTSVDSQALHHTLQSQQQAHISQLHIAQPRAMQSSFEHLLPTSLVNVLDIHGNLQQCKILLDSGSMGNLISQSLVKRLKLPMQRCNTIVSGVSSNTTSRYKSTVTVISRIDPLRKITFDAHVLPYLTSLPNESFTSPELNSFNQLDLADPRFNIRSPVEIIINAGTVFNILLPGNIKVVNNNASAQNTIFGWVLAGTFENNLSIANVPTSSAFHSCINIDRSLQLFWQSEEIAQQPILSDDELKCEVHFNTTFERNECGRFIVQLPFNDEKKGLGNSIRAANLRLLSIEKKLDQNPILKKEYHIFMSEYLALGHMEKIPPGDIQVKDDEHFYLPHHFVLKSDSTTTKLRVVFDGSAHSTSGVSLNQKLLVGPSIQEDLAIIILRFRLHNVVFCADIEKMYRQVLVHPKDRDYQRIVWRFNAASEVEHYRLTTVTYGTSSAPYLAVRSLKQLSIENEEHYPTAAKVIARDFYVDDLLSGAATLADALQLHDDITNVLKSAGFNLRKWSSNSTTFLRNINQSENGQDIPILAVEDETVKVLGLHWQPESDIFKYKVVEYAPESIITKRNFLSQASRLFDPFGWLSPAIITIKIIFQSLWLNNLGWDDHLPLELANQWSTIRKNLKCLEMITIPRQTLFNTDRIQLHGFCDASEVASAAVIYCKSYDDNGVPHVRLISAKTKVAPVQAISLPRLELIGALLLSRLLEQVMIVFHPYEPEIFAWCDSEIVLAWLADHPRRWKTYISNRTSEILKVLPRKHWNHVSSTSNPADPASRGLEPQELVKSALWWSGPPWLLLSNTEWPTNSKTYTTNIERKLKILQLETTQRSFIEVICDRISSWSRLKRVIALCRRFFHNSRNRHSKMYGIITSEEQRVAEKICIKLSQAIIFQAEILELRRHNSLKPKSSSSISSLSPFIDGDGILRVGGRLHNASCSYNMKHPFILHHSHILSRRIVEDQHILFLHPSPSLLCSLLRNNYWIVGGSNLAKQTSQKCTKCVKQRAQTSKQLMGTLPEARVNPARPFTHVGIDFAGPIMIANKKGRGVRYIKSYISVFICLTVKAIHLEVVSELSSDAFIAAFKRFVARRGLPSDVYTDNGTNFVGARKKFSEIFTVTELTENFAAIQLFCANRGIKWHFSPPSSPHFGGMWESAVKSMKTHLRIVSGRARLTFEEMQTLMAEIECILNSRPLCAHFKEDVHNIEVITPAHFLVLGPLTAIPEESYNNVPVNRLTRWQQIQQHVSSFWMKFNKEYLNTMQQRHKWKTEKNNLQVGDIVVVKEDLPASYWAIARIIDTHPGKDHLVRVVTLKTAQHSIIKRPIHKLVKLPIQ